MLVFVVATIPEEGFPIKKELSELYELPLTKLAAPPQFDQELGNRLEGPNSPFSAHVLTAIHGSNVPPNSLRRVLNILNIDHNGEESIGQLRRRLKSHITSLRRGKKVERSQDLGCAARAKDREKYCEELDWIRQMWPQLIPQSLKNKRIKRKIGDTYPPSKLLAVQGSFYVLDKAVRSQWLMACMA
ncbi:hypothetical protein B0H13DRAFT_1867098 [Mycena leptocephala]|nr:hypothetical protein B0H13DRAFT_1867098 [Mycena leptocephala]